MHIYIYIYVDISFSLSLYIYIYIYIGLVGYLCLGPFRTSLTTRSKHATANLLAKILGFRGFDSSRILVLRCGIPTPKGKFPKC